MANPRSSCNLMQRPNQQADHDNDRDDDGDDSQRSSQLSGGTEEGSKHVVLLLHYSKSASFWTVSSPYIRTNPLICGSAAAMAPSWYGSAGAGPACWAGPKCSPHKTPEPSGGDMAFTSLRPSRTEMPYMNGVKGFFR